MRKEKQLLLDEIREKIDHAQGMVITSYNKLTPMHTWALAEKLRKSGAEFEVVKKRLLLKAAEKSGIRLELKELMGHIAVVFVKKDPSPVVKVIFEFSDENEDTLKVITGKLDGSMQTAADLKLLSQLPSLDEMRARILSVLESPMSQTLAVVDSMLTSVIHCIENKSKIEK